MPDRRWPISAAKASPAVTEALLAIDRNGRRCWITPGAGDAWGVHAFEQPNVQRFPYPNDLHRCAFVSGAAQQIACALPGHADRLALGKRLARFGLAPGVNRIRTEREPALPQQQRLPARGRLARAVMWQNHRGVAQS